MPSYGCRRAWSLTTRCGSDRRVPRCTVSPNGVCSQSVTRSLQRTRTHPSCGLPSSMHPSASAAAFFHESVEAHAVSAFLVTSSQS